MLFQRPDVATFFEILNFFCSIYCNRRVQKKCAVDHGFEPRTYQAKDFNIGICYFSIQQVELTDKSKEWLAWNQDKHYI